MEILILGIPILGISILRNPILPDIISWASNSRISDRTRSRFWNIVNRISICGWVHISAHIVLCGHMGRWHNVGLCILRSSFLVFGHKYLCMRAEIQPRLKTRPRSDALVEWILIGAYIPTLGRLLGTWYMSRCVLPACSMIWFRHLILHMWGRDAWKYWCLLPNAYGGFVNTTRLIAK